MREKCLCGRGGEACDCDDPRCPDCGAVWEKTHTPCPGCGLTIEAVAERLAA